MILLTAIGKTRNCGIPDVLLIHEKNFTAVIIGYISIRCYDVCSTSIRWIVHTLMLKRTYEWQPVAGLAPSVTPHIVAINPACCSSSRY